MTYVELNSIVVDFPMYDINSRSIKKNFIKFATGGFLDKTNPTKHPAIKALDNVSIIAEHGDRIGVIGPNGSGKTTLLKTIAGIYEPILGSIKIVGNVATLFDIMVGVIQDCTGYENILLRGLLLGLNKKQIKNKIDEIAEFTELGSYLNLPTRTYSSGMQLRLAFAIATSIQPDILIMDEIIGVGDEAFMEKAKKRVNNLIQNSGIVFIASHSRDIIENVCNKVAYMKAGKLEFLGDKKTGIEKYLD